MLSVFCVLYCDINLIKEFVSLSDFFFFLLLFGVGFLAPLAKGQRAIVMALCPSRVCPY